MIAHDEVPSFDEVSSIHFDGPEAYDVVWQEYSEDNAYTVCSDDVYYKQEGDDLLPLDTSAVEGYLSAISNAGYTEYVTYNVTDEELATYGLDDPEVTVTVEYTEAHPKVQIEFYRYDGEHCLAVVDGAPFALVARSAVVDLIEAVNTIVL